MPHLTLDQRLTRMSECRGIHVAYSLAMPGGRIDRDAWAKEIQALVLRFDPGPRGEGNKSAFARRVGVTTRTMERWAKRETDVKIETVQAVIDALDLTPSEGAELLQRIGFYVGSRPVPVEPRDDPVVRAILEDRRLNEDQRAALVRRELARIKREQEQRMADYQFFIEQRQERGSA